MLLKLLLNIIKHIKNYEVKNMKIGFIGLGAMGGYMAINLAKNNLLQIVFNRTTSKTKLLKKEFACSVSNSPLELAKQCEVIIISVSRDVDVLEIINEIKPGIKANSIVIDTSTVSSETAKKAASILSQVNSNFLDCPVSGGVEGAKNATLAMMVGGAEEVLDKVRPILNSIAKNIVYIGPNGTGQATKAVNQIMAAVINQAVTEALVFGEAMGLPMDKVIEIVSTGAAGNWFLDHRGETMQSGKFEPGFKLSLHHKDLLICQSMMRSLNKNAFPITEMTLADYQQLINEGH